MIYDDNEYHLNDLMSFDVNFNAPPLNCPILLSRLLGGASPQNPVLLKIKEKNLVH